MTQDINTPGAKSHSTLFLMELVIVIFFFTLTCAICVQIFVRSHIVSDSSSETTNAVFLTENAAQIYFSCGGNLDRIEDEFGNCAVILEQDGCYSGTLLLCLDKNGNPIAPPAPFAGKAASNSAYELILHETLEDASEFYKDISDAKRHGYASSAHIILYTVKPDKSLITGLSEAKSEKPLFGITTDLYLGDIQTAED